MACLSLTRRLYRPWRLLWILCTLCFALLNAQATEYGAVPESKVLRGAFYPSHNPPYLWQDKSGILRGVTYMLWQRIAKDLGYSEQQIMRDFSNPAQWLQLRQELDNGHIDAIVGVVEGQIDSDQAVLVGEPLIVLKTRIYVHQGNRYKFTTLGDFRDHLGAVSAPNPEFLRYLPAFNTLLGQGARLQNYRSKPKFIEALLNGEVEYAVKSTHVMNALRRIYDPTQQLVELDIVPAPDTRIYLAVSKNSPLYAQLPRIEELLRSYQRHGLYTLFIQRAMEQFLTEE